MFTFAALWVGTGLLISLCEDGIRGIFWFGINRYKDLRKPNNSIFSNIVNIISLFCVLYFFYKLIYYCTMFFI